jgi:transcriptional regulator GlxA family with amidase domain
MLDRFEDSSEPIQIVSSILDHCFQKNEFNPSIEQEAKKFRLSPRTLQRYFQSCTGITAKQALQVMRIRKAITALIQDPLRFDHEEYGYYDHSHFYKHLREFLSTNTFGAKDLHLRLLKLITE